MRRRIRAIRAFVARGVLHLLVVVLVVGSATLGALSAQGALNLDGSTIRVVAPARGAVSEQMAAIEDGEITIDLQPPSVAAGAPDTTDSTRVLSTPAPQPVAAIPLPAPPPVRSGAVGTSLPWAGPTGYVEGDGSLTWPVPGGYVSQYFWGGHQAVDIAHAYGGAVLAADTGTVVSAGWQNNGGGLAVTIQHSDGRVTGYNHLGSVLVSAGQGLVRGEQIGTVGCTGICTGPHVHFAVIVNGILVNPLRYL
ncbi:MAG: M23 family metallopeptidase [Candidatus Limnocylindria bacterium]